MTEKVTDLAPPFPLTAKSAFENHCSNPTHPLGSSVSTFHSSPLAFSSFCVFWRPSSSCKNTKVGQKMNVNYHILKIDSKFGFLSSHSSLEISAPKRVCALGSYKACVGCWPEQEPDKSCAQNQPQPLSPLAPLKRLHAAFWITPSSSKFVRSHNKIKLIIQVPQLGRLKLRHPLIFQHIYLLAAFASSNMLFPSSRSLSSYRAAAQNGWKRPLLHLAPHEIRYQNAFSSLGTAHWKGLWWHGEICAHVLTNEAISLLCVTLSTPVKDLIMGNLSIKLLYSSRVPLVNKCNTGYINWKAEVFIYSRTRLLPCKQEAPSSYPSCIQGNPGSAEQPWNGRIVPGSPQGADSFWFSIWDGTFPWISSRLWCMWPPTLPRDCPNQHPNKTPIKYIHLLKANIYHSSF